VWIDLRELGMRLVDDRYWPKADIGLAFCLVWALVKVLVGDQQ
jgi:hypothetical protein